MQGKRPIVTWEGNNRLAKLLRIALRDVLEEWEKADYHLQVNPEESSIWLAASRLLQDSGDLLTDITREMPCPYDGVHYSEVPGMTAGYGCPVCGAINDGHEHIEKGDDWSMLHKDHAPLKRVRRIVEKSKIAWLEPDIRINRGSRFLEIYLHVGISPNFGWRSEKAEIHTFILRSVFSLQMFEDTLISDEFLTGKIEKYVEEAGLGVLLLKEKPPVSFDFNFNAGQDDAESVRSR